MADEGHESGVVTWRTRIDEDVRGLSERMAGVESGMTNLSRGVDRLTHAFESSSNKQQELSRTRWPVVFGVLGLVGVLMGAGLSGYIRDLNRIESNLKTVQTKRISANDPAQNLRLTELERRMNRSENADMDHRHAYIMRGAEDGVRIEDLTNEVVSMRANEHLSISARSATAERLRSIERQVFGRPDGGVHDLETNHGHGVHD